MIGLPPHMQMHVLNMFCLLVHLGRVSVTNTNVLSHMAHVSTVDSCEAREQCSLLLLHKDPRPQGWVLKLSGLQHLDLLSLHCYFALFFFFLHFTFQISHVNDPISLISFFLRERAQENLREKLPFSCFFEISC